MQYITWGAYLDAPSALFVRTSCCVDVVCRVDGINLEELRTNSREIHPAEQFMSCLLARRTDHALDRAADE